jgi:hypothetical protein
VIELSRSTVKPEMLGSLRPHDRVGVRRCPLGPMRYNRENCLPLVKNCFQKKLNRLIWPSLACVGAARLRLSGCAESTSLSL